MFESAGIIRQLDIEKETNTVGLSVPALAEVVGRELATSLSALGETGASSEENISGSERGLRNIYAMMKPNLDATARFIDDPTLTP